MDTILSRLPSFDDISRWAHRNRGKLVGVFAGTVGVWVLTTFLVVAITGVPFGGERIDPDRNTVYPNF